MQTAEPRSPSPVPVSPASADLIYDIGLHRGEDAEFYLKKGFRVIGVEADADLCAEVAARFAGAVEAGRLTIVHVAIAETAGRATLYRNRSFSIWNTLQPEWAERNQRRGASSLAVEVETATLASVIERYGPAYFVKIDIEGMDVAALKSLARASSRPRYVSIESDKTSFAGLRREFAVFESLGYDRFKIVAQHEAMRQVPPNPPREGVYAAHRFIYDASGLFGEEAPGEWMSAAEAIEAYRPIFLRYALTGDDPLIGSPTLRRALEFFGFRAGWHDTHAKHRDV
ncbi:MAG: FkbM family methyltransferase [Amphiplicatus sp.]